MAVVPDARSRWTHPYRRVLVVAACAVVMALPLVAPVDGQSGSSEHRFQLVHPIFPHVHWDSDGHGHAYDDDVDAVALPSGPALTFLPAGPVGTGPIVASEGMLVPTFSAMIGLWLAARLAWRQARLIDQTWLTVPTGPPR